MARFCLLALAAAGAIGTLLTAGIVALGWLSYRDLHEPPDSPPLFV